MNSKLRGTHPAISFYFSFRCEPNSAVTNKVDSCPPPTFSRSGKNVHYNNSTAYSSDCWWFEFVHRDRCLRKYIASASTSSCHIGPLSDDRARSGRRNEAPSQPDRSHFRPRSFHALDNVQYNRRSGAMHQIIVITHRGDKIRFQSTNDMKPLGASI